MKESSEGPVSIGFPHIILSYKHQLVGSSLQTKRGSRTTRQTCEASANEAHHVENVTCQWRVDKQFCRGMIEGLFLFFCC